MSFLPVSEQLAYIKKGSAEIIRESELKSKLEKSFASGKPLKVKAGFDPTAPDLHLGHTVLLRKLKHFQDLGHTVIFLIGDFTGMIGDPTGRSATRPPLTPSRSNKTLRPTRHKSSRFSTRRKLSSTSTVAGSHNSKPTSSSDSLRNIPSLKCSSAKTSTNGSPKRSRSPCTNCLYPLAQGYDSVALEADVELGGTDQKFNLLVGRELQRAYGQESQVVLTMPILEGLDGVQKMSKSLGNAIGIHEAPLEMYGKLMSISDDMMWRYYELLTDVSMADIAKMKSDAMSGAAHPMTLKKELARKIVADFHSADAATKASEDWAKQFQKGETPETLEEVSVSLSDVRGTASAESGEPLRLDKIIARAGLASSTTEANRKIKEKAVRVDGEVITTPVIYRGTLDDPAFRVVLVVRVGRQTKKVIISR